jgi:hypothetical protein
MGRQGLANSTFLHVGGLPDLFMEHDIGLHLHLSNIILLTVSALLGVVRN